MDRDEQIEQMKKTVDTWIGDVMQGVGPELPTSVHNRLIEYRETLKTKLAAIIAG